MGFREVSVAEIREVLRLWVRGHGLRAIARLARVDRKTVRRYVETAQAAGLAREHGEGALTDELIGEVVDRVRPARPSGHGRAWELLKRHREEIEGWLKISDMVSSYHRWVRDTLRAQGVEVPVVANIKHGLAYLDWAKLEADVDLLGCNNYLDNLRSEQEYLNLTWWYGLQRARLRTTWAPEFWCGSWVEIGQDTTLFEPGHYEYVLMNAIAHGLRGANFFMFVDRDDWHYSPISGIGKPRPHLLQPFKRALPLLSELRDDRRLARIGLVWTPEHHQAFQATRHADWTTLSSIWWEDDQPKEFADWWETLRVLVEQDRDFVILDPRSGVVRWAGRARLRWAGLGIRARHRSPQQVGR